MVDAWVLNNQPDASAASGKVKVKVNKYRLVCNGIMEIQKAGRE